MSLGNFTGQRRAAEYSGESGCRRQETRNYNAMAAIGVALEAAGEAGRSILTIGDNVAL